MTGLAVRLQVMEVVVQEDAVIPLHPCGSADHQLGPLVLERLQVGAEPRELILTGIVPADAELHLGDEVRGVGDVCVELLTLLAQVHITPHRANGADGSLGLHRALRLFDGVGERAEHDRHEHHAQEARVSELGAEEDLVRDVLANDVLELLSFQPGDVHDGCITPERCP